MDFVLNFWVEFGAWVGDLMAGWGLPPWAVNLIADFVGVLILLIIGVMAVIIFTPMERKVIARMQNRPGPNRVWPYGLLQAFADAIKMLTKEDVIPSKADRTLHMLAPLLVAIPALLIYAVLPWGPGLIGQDLNVGILFVVAVGTIHILAVLIAGWGSNNKFSLLSAFRAVNQLLAYEVPMILSILTVVLFAKTMSTQGIVEAQSVPYLIVMVEYSGMKFAMFFIAEYVNMFGVAILTATLFLGGWKFFGLEDVAPVLAPVIVFAKSVFVIFCMLWFRATFPRLRFDHLVGFAWKFLVPLTMINLFLGALVVKLTGSVWGQAGLMLVANIILAVVTGVVLNRSARKLSDAPALKEIVAVER